MSAIGRLVGVLVQLILAPISAVVGLLLPKRRAALLWGPVPIINNKYWSAAMREAGWESRTVMSTYYGRINDRSDFDVYYDDLLPGWVRPAALRRLVAPHMAFWYTMRHARVVHLPFSGGPFGTMPFWWRLEAWLYHAAGIRVMVMPYGGDAYMYSRVLDPSIRQALLTSYPQIAREEPQIARRVQYWVRRADIVMCGTMIDGIGRWDVANVQPLCIDVRTWSPRQTYSRHDGRSGPVRVLHTPNHRGFKGTEFLVDAVAALKAEGLEVELVLLEGVPNTRVRVMMQEVDILAEQFIAQVYAMSAIEGMASGLPVIANLENEVYTRMYRRYGYLNECPVVSATPESLKDVLRVLVTQPALREELGRAGRAYVEKYHSYDTARYVFGAVYDKLAGTRDVDLMNLFHPLTSEFNRRLPRVQHPLLDSRLPTPGVQDVAGVSFTP